jgi:WD40 repeat protein
LNYISVFQSPDGKYIASGAIDGIINIFDVSSGKLVHTLEGKIRVFCSVSSNLRWAFGQPRTIFVITIN